MSSEERCITRVMAYSLIVGGLGWGSLLVQIVSAPQSLPLLSVFVFVLLSVSVKQLGFRVTPSVRHSLVGIIDLAAFLSLGLLGGSIVAACSGAINQLLCDRPRPWQPWLRGVCRAFFCGGLNALMMLAAGAVFGALGGQTPLFPLTWSAFPPFLVACLTWFAVDHLGWGLAELLGGGIRHLGDFMRGILLFSVLVELLPLPLSPLISAAYLSGSGPLTVLTMVTVLGTSMVLHQLMNSLAEQRRYLRELAALGALSRDLLQAGLDLEQVCQLIYRHTRKLVEAPTIVLQIKGWHADELLAPVWVQEGQEVGGSEEELGREVFDLLSSTHQPLLIPDWSLAVDVAPLRTKVPVRSGLYVPIVWEKELLGIIALQSPEALAFGQEDQKALGRIAAHAAMGLHTARLYHQERHRSAQLMAIAEVSRKVAAILDLQHLFADTVQLVQQTFGYYHTSIFTVPPEGSQVRFEASSSTAIQGRGVSVPWGQGIIGYVARSGRAYLANDVHHDELYLPEAGLEETCAELAVPLKVEERTVGVLDVQSNRRDAFDEEDIFVLQALADQIAIAIEDSQLYDAQRVQTYISTALLQVADAVGQIRSPEEVLETIVRLTPLLVGVELVLVFLWSEEEQCFRALEGAGFGAEQMAMLRRQRFAPGAIPLLAQVRREDTVIETAIEELISFLPPSSSHWPHTGICRAFPLHSKGTVIGVLVTQDPEDEGQMAAPRRAILSGIANQAAMALENARLYTAQREETWVSTALLQVANMISTSTNLSETLAMVTRLTPLLIGIDWCAILLWDERHQAFVGSRAHGLPETAATAYADRYYTPEEFPLLQRLCSENGVVTVPDTSRSPLIPQALAEALGMRSLVVLPLRARDKLLGALLGGHVDGGRLIAERQMNILAGIANQTSLAIEASQLYQQTVEQQWIQREINLARSIQQSFLPERYPPLVGWSLAVEWRAVLGVGGDYYDFIQLDDQHLGLVMADVSGKGVGAAIYMALLRTVMRVTAFDEQGPGETLRRVNRVLLEESRSNMFASVFYGILNQRSGVLTYARAGHNPPLFVHASDRRLDSLCPEGIVLGVVEMPNIQEQQIVFAPGDFMVAYTDGLTEANNDQLEEFGEERLSSLVQDLVSYDADMIIDRIDAALSAFTGSRAQFDDLTVLVLRRDARQG